MRVAILFCVALGVFIGLLMAYVFRRRPRELGWRCRKPKCRAVISRANGKFCPTCGTPRLPADASAPADAGASA